MTADQKIAAGLTLRRGRKGWWITGEIRPVGPYKTKADAQEDRRGLQAFYRFHKRRDFLHGKGVA